MNQDADIYRLPSILTTRIQPSGRLDVKSGRLTAPSPSLPRGGLQANVVVDVACQP